LTASERLVRDARRLTHEASPLAAELWASMWLGSGWLNAGISERQPESDLIVAVTSHCSVRPSTQATAAICALLRVAANGDRSMLAEAVETLRETQHLPPFAGLDAAWQPTAGWTASDVWSSRRRLLIEYDGPVPHCLYAVLADTHGWSVETLEVLQPEAAQRFVELGAAGEMPMPMETRPADEVLAELAATMGRTDMFWPRYDDERYVSLRALAWSRCRDHEPDRPGFEPMPDDDRAALIDEFVGTAAVTEDTARSLGRLFVDYGDGYLANGVLGWHPVAVELFMLDWLPRKAYLDADERTALPDVLRAWLRFVLAKRGIEEPWVTPVVETVDEFEEEFRASFEDESASGPAKEVLTALIEREVDLEDPEAVERAISQYNAEQLARRLTES
jgi:hypothetical protein